MQERFQSVAKELKREIERGRYPVGAALPSRHALAARFKVTRSTIDRAVATLAREGWVLSRQGAPTAVASKGVPRTIAFVGRVSDVSPEVRIRYPRLAFWPYEQLESRSQRQALRRCDGIVWHLPEERALDWMGEFEQCVPQIVVNRELENCSYISTAHKGAIRDVTLRRLKACPVAAPFFLGDDGGRQFTVERSRFEGFVSACRERCASYEALDMPESFEGKVDLLERRVTVTSRRPALLVAPSARMTGAVMFWARMRNLVWRRDVWYSDFDNTLESHVWGKCVTTFRQDFKRLVALALEGLTQLMAGKRRRIQRLIPPRFVEGDT